MKKDQMEILISIFISLIILGVLYFFIQNYSKGETKNIPISYETINVNTNLKLGISEYDSINPYLTNNRDVIYLTQLIYEPLLTITYDYKINNCLASEVSKIDSKTYIIKLKENIMWSDGTSLSSKDVDFSINELKSKTNSTYYENVEQINKVEVIDGNTLRLELKKEVPFFEYNLIFPILCSNNYNNIPIGTGMYKIEEIEEDKIKLSLNKSYRELNEENTNTRTITIYLYNTMGEIFNDFKLGKIDLVHTQNSNIEKYIGSMGYKKETYCGREYEYISFNLENSILSNLEVRKAIALSINQEKIVNTILEGKAVSSYLPIEDKSYLLKEIRKYKL